jgi:hypothetical protein
MFSMLMSLVIVGAAVVWFFAMGGKDFLWSIVKLIFGGGVDSLFNGGEKEDDNDETGQEQRQNNNNNEILRRSEPIVRKPLLQLESEERLPMNAYLGKRIQPRI